MHLPTVTRTATISAVWSAGVNATAAVTRPAAKLRHGRVPRQRSSSTTWPIPWNGRWAQRLERVDVHRQDAGGQLISHPGDRSSRGQDHGSMGSGRTPLAASIIAIILRWLWTNVLVSALVGIGIRRLVTVGRLVGTGVRRLHAHRGIIVIVRWVHGN
jgi:hypothetical protein